MNIKEIMAMKFRTLRRHVREGFKNIWRNGWMSVASIGAVTVTIILVGTFVAIMLNVNEMAHKVEEDVEIKVLIDLTEEDDEVTEIGDEIVAISGVGMVYFSTKDEDIECLVESIRDHVED